jgi:type IV secretory pathway TrbD component
MTPSDTATTPRASRADAPALDDGLGRPVPVAPQSRRERIRSKPGLGQAYRIGVFVAGLACIAVGFALAVLPGPLTIPPVLLGLWIWSTEFAFAERFFDRFKDKARDAWDHAKRHPVSSALITIGGLVLAGVAFWAVGHFELVAKAKDAVGL